MRVPAKDAIGWDKLGENVVASVHASFDVGNEADCHAEYVCWTRIQAEAGQPLEAILRRKERERRAGNGLFLWGVGNPPALLIRPLARLGTPVPVVFSVMQSRPKPVDASPARTLVWRSYFDKEDRLRQLPPHVMVTSRGDSASGPKRTHYALMCLATEQLKLASGIGFDHLAYCNASGTGAPVGASQVTALLKRSAEGTSVPSYEVNMRAELTGSYWVRLADPRELSERDKEMLAGADPQSNEQWMQLVAHIRQDHAGPSVASEDLLLI